MTTCAKCGVPKELSEFYPRRAKKHKFNLICKGCCQGRSRTRDLWVKYGLTDEVVQKMKLEQGGTCAICKTVPNLKKGFCVDHNHVTGEVRALLCQNCNIAIGMLKDSVVLAEHAVAYLKKHSK